MVATLPPRIFERSVPGARFLVTKSAMLAAAIVNVDLAFRLAEAIAGG